jgi:glycosyltransferase involved in cell wall biosynthesis
VRLLYAGQLLDYKGPDVLLQAAAILKREMGRDVRVSVVGDGPMRRELEELAETLPVPVDFTGAVDHGLMPEIYRSHDVFAFTSTWREPFGLTHLEAMASGTPVVSTAVGGQKDFLRDGENALVVPPHDPTALATAIERLVSGTDLARRVALNGRRTVEESFTLDRYIDDLEGWLHEVRERRER